MTQYLIKKRLLTKEEITDLSRIVEKLEYPDRVIDAQIAYAFGWVHDCDSTKWSVIAPHWSLNGKTIKEITHSLSDDAGSILPYFTSSIDHALSCIPSWLTPTIIGHEREVYLLNGAGLLVGGTNYRSKASTLVNAVMASALKALAHSKQEKFDVKEHL